MDSKAVFRLKQGCPILVLEDQCPAEFSFNQLQHSCLEVSSKSEDLKYQIQVCLIRVGAKLCRTSVPSGTSLDTFSLIHWSKAEVLNSGPRCPPLAPTLIKLTFL